jgi:8-oxo-dGTP pyrophosphatase MutT (NUDIX family)
MIWGESDVLELDDQTIYQIKRELAAFASFKSLPDKNLRPAAVLVPIFNDNCVWKCLFIRRSEIGEFHKGEVAFPGGGKESVDEDIIHTALRETNEELGIVSTDIDVLGTLPEMKTISNYRVTPVIGIIKWPVKLTPSRDEVARVFSIPLDWLMDDTNWKISEIDVANRGKISTIIYDTYDGENLWGLTARITQLLIEMIKRRAVNRSPFYRLIYFQLLLRLLLSYLFQLLPVQLLQFQLLQQQVQLLQQQEQ